MLHYLIMGLLFISCQGQEQHSETVTKKVEVQLTDLNDKHPNKKQMELLLNNYKEEFIACKWDIDSLKKQSLIQQQYCFQGKHSNVSLILIFCEQQEEALNVAAANFNANSITQKWGVNGATLFVVKGNDEFEVNSVLAHFAGEE